MIEPAERGGPLGVEVLPDAVGAVVLDCDGLLADTERTWERVVRDFLREAAPDPGGPEGRDVDVHGLSIEVAAARIARSPQEVDAVAAELERRFRRAVEVDARPMPGAVELVHALSGRVPVAVASNSPRDVLDAILTRIGLADRIDASVAADEVPLPKPESDVYRAAAAALGVPTLDAVAFEDSPVGASAAAHAGLVVIGVNADPAVELVVHGRLRSLDDPRLTAWARRVRRKEADEPPRPEPMLRIDRALFDGGAPVRTRARYRTGSAGSSRIVVVPDDDRLTFDRPPSPGDGVELPVPPGDGVLEVDLGVLPPGDHRLLLVRDGAVPHWEWLTAGLSVGPDGGRSRPAEPAGSSGGLDVLSWNLWFGGSLVRGGRRKQLERIVEASVDVVALQECFGTAAEELADHLGWSVVAPGDDVAVISRHPADDVTPAGLGFAAAARVHAPSGDVVVWSVHLDHRDYGPYLTDDPAAALVSRGERARVEQIDRVLAAHRRIAAPDEPVVIAGDFNTPSHRDWDGRRRPRVRWPATALLEQAGFEDLGAGAGPTWSPLSDPATEPQDRIDFIHVRGLHGVSAATLAPSSTRPKPDHLGGDWPSDHAAVLARTVLPSAARPAGAISSRL